LTASNIQITAGSGTRLATNSYTEGGVTVHDEKFISGEYPYPTYSVQAATISVATTADHVVQLMAGSSLNVRIRRIYVVQSTVVTTGAFLPLIVLRLTTAGTGGTSVTPAKFVTADGAAGATAMTLPSSKGTESTELFRRQMVLTQTIATSSSIAPYWEWVQASNEEPLIIAAGTTNGIALKVGGGRAGATVDATIEFVETSF
jgi:hypothetical protein